MVWTMLATCPHIIKINFSSASVKLQGPALAPRGDVEPPEAEAAPCCAPAFLGLTARPPEAKKGPWIEGCDIR